MLGFIFQHHGLHMGYIMMYYGWACEILHHQKDGWNPNKIMGKKHRQLVQDFATIHSIYHHLGTTKKSFAPSPSHHHKYRWYSNLPFLVMGGWHCFTAIGISLRIVDLLSRVINYELLTRIWLVVDLPLWKILVSWDHCSQYMEK